MATTHDSSSLEKKRSSSERLENAEGRGYDHNRVDSVDAEHAGTDKTFAKRTVRHVDRRVLPILAALYAISLYGYSLMLWANALTRA